VPFAAWELPELSAAWCLREAGLRPGDLDAVAYSFDPGLGREAADLGLDDPIRRHADGLCPAVATVPRDRAARPGPGAGPVRAAPRRARRLGRPVGAGGQCGAGARQVASQLAGVYRDCRLEVLKSQELPHSLGLLYEGLTRHLGFLHSSDAVTVGVYGVASGR
jgi:carbamoyltransferase